MIKAFVIGQETLISGQVGQRMPEALEWLDVPPRSRETLAHMTFSFSSRFRTALSDSHEQPVANELEVFEVSGRKRWAFVRENVLSDRSVADGSVSPLRKLGLIRPLPDNEVRYELTESGVKLCQEYWRRSDADDPTLPRQSMR